MTKRCKACSQEKDAREFYARQATCKECYKAKVRKHRADNLEAHQAYDRERGQLPHRKAEVLKRAPTYNRKPGRIQAMRAKNPLAAAARIAPWQRRPRWPDHQALGVPVLRVDRAADSRAS